jgi:hypothetical protein
MAQAQTIDLQKKVETATISLSKKGITKVPPLRVVADYDVSGSMMGLYRNGVVQKSADQVLGVGMKFDDDGQVDSFIFGSTAAYVGTQTEDEFGTFVKDTILSRDDLWSSTNYGNCLQANMDFLFGGGVRSKAWVPGKKGLFGTKKGGYETKTFKSEGKDPALVLFFTDGRPDNENTDRARSIIAAAEKAGTPVYFNLIGVGSERFSYLQALADEFDNCGFVGLRDFNMTDAALYDALLGTEEFIAFIKKHGAS